MRLTHEITPILDALNLIQFMVGLNLNNFAIFLILSLYLAFVCGIYKNVELLKMNWQNLLSNYEYFCCSKMQQCIMYDATPTITAMAMLT